MGMIYEAKRLGRRRLQMMMRESEKGSEDQWHTDERLVKRTKKMVFFLISCLLWA
jgi:hypothetical protein